MAAVAANCQLHCNAIWLRMDSLWCEGFHRAQFKSVFFILLTESNHSISNSLSLAAVEVCENEMCVFYGPNIYMFHIRITTISSIAATATAAAKRARERETIDHRLLFARNFLYAKHIPHTLNFKFRKNTHSETRWKKTHTRSYHSNDRII